MSQNERLLPLRCHADACGRLVSIESPGDVAFLIARVYTIVAGATARRAASMPINSSNSYW